jgi:hypothetical protein
VTDVAVETIMNGGTSEFLGVDIGNMEERVDRGQ